MFWIPRFSGFDMTLHRVVNRRIAVAEMGKAGLAVMVFGLAACANGEDEISPVTSTVPITTSTTHPPPPTTLGPSASMWERVNLGIVSAYILYRAGEAVIVDTGVAGSTGDIGAALNRVDLAWDAVGHVILTHKHPDHIGSLDEVVSMARGPAVYAGVGDIPAIKSKSPITPVADGDSVFDLDIIETPGHTPGHISVLDPVARVLVAGDALNGTDGGVTGANPSFSEDMVLAGDSVMKLAGFRYDVALFGHGEPLLEGASGAVAALADG